MDTKGPPARSDRWWSVEARTSFPTPVSPTMRTLMLPRATIAMTRCTCFIAGSATITLRNVAHRFVQREAVKEAAADRHRRGTHSDGRSVRNCHGDVGLKPATGERRPVVASKIDDLHAGLLEDERRVAAGHERVIDEDLAARVPPEHEGAPTRTRTARVTAFPEHRDLISELAACVLARLRRLEGRTLHSGDCTRRGPNCTERYNGAVRRGHRSVWFAGLAWGHVRCTAKHPSLRSWSYR